MTRRSLPKHKSARNPFRWVPALTLIGLAFAGGVSLSAYASHAAPSAPVSPSVILPPAKPAPRVISPPAAPVAALTTYTVKPGDSLWSIALAHCGSGSDYTALAAANHITSWVISPGKVITLTC